MNDNSVPFVPEVEVPDAQKSTLGDRIRTIANQLRQEDEVQIKATSRILGAAAQLTENHDRLIDEVVEMVEEDLDQGVHLPQSRTYTVEQLQQQFESFSNAKAHFNLKARSWNTLVEKLNAQAQITSTSVASSELHPQPVSATEKAPQDPGFRDLERIEQELKRMRGDMARVLQLLELLVKQLT